MSGSLKTYKVCYKTERGKKECGHAAAQSKKTLSKRMKRLGFTNVRINK